jgi:hypothetical protein
MKSLTLALVVAVAMGPLGCGLPAPVVGNKIACGSKTVLAGADALYAGIDLPPEPWAIIVGAVLKLGTLIAGTACELTKESAQHLLAEMDQPVAQPDGAELGAQPRIAGPPVRACRHRVQARHRQRLEALLSPQAPAP